MRYGVTVKVLLFVTPLTVTRMAGVSTVVTAPARTTNDALVEPAANDNDSVVGAAADGLVLATVALKPPGGAGHSIVPRHSKWRRR